MKMVPTYEAQDGKRYDSPLDAYKADLRHFINITIGNEPIARQIVDLIAENVNECADILDAMRKLISPIPKPPGMPGRIVQMKPIGGEIQRIRGRVE